MSYRIYVELALQSTYRHTHWFGFNSSSVVTFINICLFWSCDQLDINVSTLHLYTINQFNYENNKLFTKSHFSHQIHFYTSVLFTQLKVQWKRFCCIRTFQAILLLILFLSSPFSLYFFCHTVFSYTFQQSFFQLSFCPPSQVNHELDSGPASTGQTHCF